MCADRSGRVSTLNLISYTLYDCSKAAMDKRDFVFDIVATVAERREASKSTQSAYDDGWKCFAYVFGSGLLLAASLWDVYYRFLRFCGALVVIELVELIDIVLRVGLVVVSVVQFVEYWVVEDGRHVDLDILPWFFWALSLCSCLLYCAEHLYGST